ncbi:copper resistance protein CopZ [Sneathiella chungangensis]|uniref:Copper resistance protein CopZ n=1 Tax=Sneathiella chungangensis TaxID=1418234 RepID=A0A845MIK4_9PROT|nr:copper resistance protein CopZ [Sneathiella chungangensis]
MKPILRLGVAILLLTVAAACDDIADIAPPPQALKDDAVGAYCGMILVEHAGPKGQVFEKGRKDPLWFTAVRDAIAYTRLPGESQHTVGFYVHDMALATSWEEPQRDGIWIAADSAFYVVGSDKRGGMGMLEMVPFGTRDAADAFAAEHGGKVMKLDEIPDSLLLPESGSAGETVAENPRAMGNHK